MDVDQNFIDGTSLVADFAVEENVTKPIILWMIMQIGAF